MDAQQIKEHIIVNEKIEFVLDELGCHHIKPHDNHRYYSCSFPDGDNKGAINVYTDALNVVSYTRNIEDKYGNSDIISLTCYIKDFYFTQAIKWLSDILGIDYYSDEDEEMPMSLQITRMLLDMNENIDNTEENERIKPINEHILSYYVPCVNDLFFNDGVSYETQQLFEVGFDESTQRFTIPIRDELGSLVGVKGRWWTKGDDRHEKYLYLEKCAKSKLLFGLHLAMKYIKEQGFVIVVESEKSAMVLWSQGIRNVVAIGGHKLSKTQVEKLTRLGIKEVVLCYDQDVNRLENGKIDRKEYIKEANKFIPQIKVTAMVDLNGELLGEKDSPVDNMNVYYKLFEERKVLQIGE